MLLIHIHTINTLAPDHAPYPPALWMQPVTAGAEGRSVDELSQQVSDHQAVISARLLSDVLRPGSGERNDTSRTLTGDSGPVPNLLKLLPLLIYLFIFLSC